VIPFRQREVLRPFPSVPEAVKARYGASDLALRPFGLYERDLNVDFGRTPRPILVTQLIESCTRHARNERVEQSFFWHLPVGKRIECLLTLVPSEDGSGIPISFQCSNARCEGNSEIEIFTEEVAALQDEAYVADRVNVALENGVLALRRPTGSDQRAWLDAELADKEAALRTMVCTLLLNGAEDAWGHSLGDEQVECIEEAMEEHDPLVNFKLRVRCPSCELDHLITIDLEELSLRELRRAQLRLLASVHRLAACYHWSERQIFAVPHWRRAHYLSLIESERSQ